MSQSLQVHAYDWIIKDKHGENDETIINCWALDKDSNPYLLIINNFPVFCFIELPFFNNYKREIRWTTENAKLIVTKINTLLYNDCKILKSELLECQKLYYYQGDRKTKFLRVYFNNIASMKQCKYKLDNAIYTEMGLLKFDMHEYDIDVIRKLLTLKNIHYSSWFEVDAIKVEKELKISTIKREYRINWTTMKSIPDSICKEWETRPGVLSWDIECYSDNPLAMPNKFHDKHVAYMISAIYKQYKVHDSIKRYGIIIGDCNQIPKEKLDHCIIIQTVDECTMVEAFASVVIETDPEILVGYNIFSFDYPYLDHRIKRQIFNWPKMSRIIGEIPKINANTWSSNAYGHNDNNILNMSGRISIDLLPIVKRDYNMDTYTLNAVCLKFIQKEKHDVTPKQMFEYYEYMNIATQNYKNNPNDDTKKILEKAILQTTEVMEYCIKDSELVLELMECLDVWVGLIELSNIVGVTIVDIFTKGQQVRCVSQLYNLAASKNIVINKKLSETYHYKGGKVQDPIPGLHENIICLDFRSLYPSIIDGYNLCYTTLVAKEHMDYVPDDECHIIEFDQDEEVDEKQKEKEEKEDDDPIIFKKSRKKEIITKKVHYKFKFHKNKPGLLPMLVRNLVAERNVVRGIQKTEKNPHVKMVLEKRQLALKVSANSFYGFLGVREGGKLPCIEAAMCVTAKGRELITAVATYLENKYGASVIYGDTDTVRGTVPILVRFADGTIDYIQMKDLILYATKNDQLQYHIDKAEEDGKQKYYMKDQNIEVWSDNKWTRIIYLMRHRNTKRLYRVGTYTGIVDVTEDHSLLNPKGEEVTVNDINVGDDLLHYNLPNIEDPNATNITTETAWVWGFFMAEGTAGCYTTKRKSYSWSISNQNQELLQRARNAMLLAEPGFNFIIDPCMKSSSVDKLNARGQVKLLAQKYCDLFYTDRNEYIKQHINTNLGARYKKVPSQILMATNDIKQAFFEGWYAGDGTVKDSKRFDIKGQIGAAGLYMICNAIGYNINLNIEKPSNPLGEIYRLNLSKLAPQNPINRIKKIIPLGILDEDVFDIETENHHFAAGPGRMIVHNSVMVDLHIKDSKQCQYWGELLAQEISGVNVGDFLPASKTERHTVAIPGLFPPPLGTEFEKAMRLFCIKKKKYAAYLLDKDGNFKKQVIKDKNGIVIRELDDLEMLKKGIVLARRDNNKLLKIIYLKILNLIMNRGTFKEAFIILMDTIIDLKENRVNHMDLKSSRALGSHYKSESNFMHIFANELRKIGKLVNPGDRLEFLVIEKPGNPLVGYKMVLLSDYIESLSSDNPMKLDYIHYIQKVLKNPIDQLFEIGFGLYLTKFKNVTYTPARKRNPIYLTNPCKMAFHMMENGLDIIKFKQTVLNYINFIENPVKLNIIQ